MTSHLGVDYLDLEDVLALTGALLGGPPPIRDVGLLASAVARPQATVLGDDAYSDMWTKAGALLQSLVNNHALIDGNKRLGWLATAVFLEINEHSVAQADNGTVYDLVIDVASTVMEVSQIAKRLQVMGE